MNVDEVEKEGLQLLSPEKNEAIESLNINLSISYLSNETPVKKKWLSEKKYRNKKLRKVTETLRTNMLGLNPAMKCDI